MFQLSPEEKIEVVANCDHLTKLKFFKALPHAFTGHGAIIAANVLNSHQVIQERLKKDRLLDRRLKRIIARL